jgi:protein AaeX
VRFTEISLFGVYIAPISMMLVVAWLILTALRRAANHFDLRRFVWHPALFELAIYTIVLSSLVLLLGWR